MFDPGDEIGEYEVIRVIGAGGMGAVLEVRDGEGDSYALKYCTHADATIRKRFKREVRIMAKIHHKHVVRVVDTDLDNDPPYFVMTLASGTLADELADLADNEDDALDAFDEMCRGVQAIHNSDAVHRDIKPLNALRLDNGRVVVSDLGLARLNTRDTTTLTQFGQFLGTRIYCAPEQLLPDGARDADGRTDIYQLGKTLYELLTGQSPALMDLKLIPSGISHVIQKATRENPDDRYQDIGHLMDAVNLYRESKDPASNPREALESLLQQVKDESGKGRYDTDTVRKLLHFFTSDKLSTDTIMDSFARIPKKLLATIASKFSDELRPALQAYVAAVDDQVAAKPFPYAETVANAMEIVFNGSKTPELRVLALKAALIAAVSLNRFAAMETFNVMLQNLTPADDLPTADMLRENMRQYGVVAPQVPADRLLSAVRKVRETVIKESEE